jgi:hypothetical protein
MTDEDGSFCPRARLAGYKEQKTSKILVKNDIKKIRLFRRERIGAVFSKSG